MVNAGHDDDASKKSTSWRTRSLVGAAMLAVAAVAGVSGYRAYTAGPVPLRLKVGASHHVMDKRWLAPNPVCLLCPFAAATLMRLNRLHSPSNFNRSPPVNKART